jgi:hypothetical protein
LLERRTTKEFRIFVIVPPEALPFFSTAITPEDTRAIAGGKIVKCATEDTRG